MEGGRERVMEGGSQSPGGRAVAVDMRGTLGYNNQTTSLTAVGHLNALLMSSTILVHTLLKESSLTELHLTSPSVSCKSHQPEVFEMSNLSAA